MKPLFKTWSSSGLWMGSLAAIVLSIVSGLYLKEDNFIILRWIIWGGSIVLIPLGYFSKKRLVLWEDRIEFKYLLHSKTYFWSQFDGWFPMDISSEVKGVLGASAKIVFPGIRLQKTEKDEKSLSYNTIELDSGEYLFFDKIYEIITMKLKEIEVPEWAEEMIEYQKTK